MFMGNISTNGIIKANNMFINNNQVLHTGNWSSYCAPVNHSHNFITKLGEGYDATKRSYDYTVALATGGWNSDDDGYKYTWGTTLDVSGYSTWYHRLAFNTNGYIDYYHGINTKTMSYIGRFLMTNNFNQYALPLTGGTTSGSLWAHTVSASEIDMGVSNTSGSIYFYSNKNACGIWASNGDCLASVSSSGQKKFYTTNHGSSLPSSGYVGEIFYKLV